MAHQDKSTNESRVRRRVRQEDEPQDEHSRRGSTGMFYLEDLCYGQFICTLCLVLRLTSD